MLRKIKLYGALAKFIGRKVFEADVASTAEAVRFLISNFPQVEKYMSDKHYRISVGDYDLKLEELHDPIGSQEIKIIPVIGGAGGAAGRIIAGVAIVALSLLFAPGGALASAAFTLGSQAVTIGVGIGASLILGGVAQLISPVPVVAQGPGSDKDPRKTYNFSGIQQTSRQGVPVPIVYGKTLCGSIVISAGIDTVQVKA